MLSTKLAPYAPALLAALVTLVVLPTIGALVNWMLWWDTPERWDAFAAEHPKQASAIRLLRAVFPHLRKALGYARDALASKYAGPPQSGRASVAAMAVCLVLSLAGMLRCSGPQHPGDAGADWRPGTTIALVVIDGSVHAALAEDAATGLAGADLATYDAALRGAHDALQSAEGHIANGASACQLHTDAALLVDLFERVAAILSAQGKPVPSSIVSGAARLAGVLDAILPPCVDAGAGLSARLRVAYRLTGSAR